MCSPLHIRAPTRPLILRIVTEPYLTGLVASSISISIPVVVVVAYSVGVKRCSTSPDDRADNRAFLSTNRCTEQRAATCTGSGGYLVAVAIPNRSIAIPISIITTSVITLLVASPVVIASQPRLCSNWNSCHAERHQTDNC